MLGLIIAAAAALQASAAPAEVVGTTPPSVELRRYPADEAEQGVGVDAHDFYAVDDSRIAKYDRATGRKVAEWSGDPKVYPHINSCEIVGPELVCASSNYPQTPMQSAVEVFDPLRMVHLRTIALGQQGGSLTWVDRRDGFWWAGFANYDGRGGDPRRDHRATKVVKFDDAWRPLRTWAFPASVLDRFAPKSNSGGGWGDDGLLYVTGHDRAELYALRIPASGSTLEHVATIPIQVGGQAFAWDRSQPRVLFGISRAGHEVAAMRIPALGD